MLFRRKDRKKTEKAGAGQREAPETIGGHAVPRHIGDVWQIVQEIAVREDPAWAERNIVRYYHQGAEAQKDILRWLAIYQKRYDPNHEFRFPPHHPRHRGCCLIPRHWTMGIRWEAFDDSEWTRIPVPPQTDRASLEAALDAYIDDAATAKCRLHRSNEDGSRPADPRGS